METRELIDDLARGLVPVPRHALAARMARGLLPALALSFLVLWAWLGFRPDTARAVHTVSYWLKFSYTLALALGGFWAAERLARPGARALPAFLALALVAAAMAAISAIELMMSAPQARMELVMGSSAAECPLRVVLISLPIFAGTFWSLSAMAPTRPVLAGAVAGFAAGALGAWVYAFRCDETAAPFVLVFFTLGIALVGALGALVARRVFRW